MARNTCEHRKKQQQRWEEKSLRDLNTLTIKKKNSKEWLVEDSDWKIGAMNTRECAGRCCFRGKRLRIVFDPAGAVISRAHIAGCSP